MAYQALYRKWRPQVFGDVKGQDHIVTAIRNQVASGRMSHAYLFCGTRGTGKTTVAKILAKAVNCENPQNGEPCGCCRSCRSVDEGNSMNVMEIDAASNNGVDYVREIRDEVQYAPTEGKYKVYIIDEAHMLTNNAWNALLKTLEEPPEYVIFIFATTEANKILATVLSRVQRYDFRRIESSVIAERLAQVTQSEQMDIEDNALRFIAAKGEGSLRDAITLLDKCAAACFGGTITYDKVLNVLGVSDNENCSRIYRAVVKGDVTDAIRCCHECFESGIDAPNFVTDLIRYLRALMLLQTTEGDEDVLEMTRESIDRLKKDKSLADVSVIIRYLKLLSELYGQLRSSAQKITLIEMTLVRMARPETDGDELALLQRIHRLEREIAELKKNGIAAPASGAAAAAQKPQYPDQDYYMGMYSSPEAYYGDEPEDMPPADPYDDDGYYPEPPTSPYADEDGYYEEPSYDPEPRYDEPRYDEPAFAPEPVDRSTAAGPAHSYEEPAYSEPSREEPSYDEPSGGDACVSDADIMSRWGEIIRSVGGAAPMYLGNARIVVTSGANAILVFASQMEFDFGGDDRNVEIVAEQIEKMFGVKLTLTPRVDDGTIPASGVKKNSSKKPEASQPGRGPAADAKQPDAGQAQTTKPEAGRKLDHDSLQNLFGMTVDSE